MAGRIHDRRLLGHKKLGGTWVLTGDNRRMLHKDPWLATPGNPSQVSAKRLLFFRGQRGTGDRFGHFNLHLKASFQ